MADSGEKTLLQVLDEDAKQILNTIPKGNGLERFRQAFEQVLDKVREVYQKEKSTHLALTEPVEAAMRQSRIINGYGSQGNGDEGDAVNSLEKEVEMTRRLLEVSQLREEEQRQSIVCLKKEIEVLKRVVEQEEALMKEEGLDLPGLLALKRELATQSEQLGRDGEHLRKQLTALETELKDLKLDKERTETHMSQMVTTLNVQKLNLERQRRRREKCETEFKTFKEDLETLKGESNILQEKLELATQQNKEKEQLILDLKAENEELVKETEVLAAKYAEILEDCEQHTQLIEKLDTQNAELNHHLHTVESELRNQNKELVIADREKQQFSCNLEFLQKEVSKAELERRLLENQISELEKEMDCVRQAASGEHHVLSKLMREKNLLQQKLKRLEVSWEKQLKAAEVDKEVSVRIRKDFVLAQEALGLQRLALSSLEDERDRVLKALLESKKEMEALQEQRRSSEEVLQKKKQETGWMEQQTAEYKSKLDKMQAEQDHLEQLLARSREDAAELDHKVKTMTYTLEKLKEDITNQELKLVQEQQTKHRLEKDLEAQRRLLSETLRRNSDTKRELYDAEKEKSRMEICLQDVTDELRQTQIQADKYAKDKMEIQRRLKEKQQEALQAESRISLLEGELKNERVHCGELESKLKFVDVDCKLLMSRKEKIRQQLQSCAPLKKELNRLQKWLSEERKRRAVLEADKRVPVRMHPWRQLEATDPAAFEQLLYANEQMRKKIRKNSVRQPSLSFLPPVKSTMSSGEQINGENAVLQRALLHAILTKEPEMGPVNGR